MFFVQWFINYEQPHDDGFMVGLFDGYAL